MSPSPKPVCFSGVQPSGNPTLGNYIGAFRPFTSFQDTHNTFFCVVDHHAITARQDPKELHENSFAVAAWYIASGLNPNHCNLFIQSHVPAHNQLGWILNTFTQMGELERMTQYKDKSARQKDTGQDNINVGLFGYPVLMAADILLYNTNEVPVGDDQIQHIELCRDVATRFNNLYGDTFTMPKGVTPKAGARVKDLQEPTRKMSKSLPGAGCLLLADTPEEAAKKIKRAVTDTLNHIAYDPANQPGVSNLIEILGACTGRTIPQVVKEMEGQQYGALKNAVAEAVVFTLEPLQARYNELMSDKAELLRILTHGADKAEEVATATLKRAMEKVGYVTR
jgi:tryptophanyl-tRNA synthetase